MGYARSAAFKILDGRLSGLNRTVAAAGRLRIGGRYNQLYRESMLSSTILLGFAYFEGYVSDVTNDVCRALASPGVVASTLPDDLRAHVAISANIKLWSGIQDPAKQRQKIIASRIGGAFEVLNDSASVTTIDVGAVLGGITYPKPDNVMKLLGRLGIPEPKKALVRRGGHAIHQQLTSIHDARAELAHTGMLPAWTTSDYTARIAGLKSFSSALDKVLHRHVVEHVGSTNWIA